MASLTQAFNKEFLDSVLPTFGNTGVNLPRWDSGQKMFICEEYESANGHRYYKGIRFCNRIVVVEKVGLYHTWTYLDGLELYAFNGKKLELVQKKDFDKVFRNENLVREQSEAMLRDYLKGIVKLQGGQIDASLLEQEVAHTIEGCYKDFLDEDYNMRLTQILPQLTQD